MVGDWSMNAYPVVSSFWMTTNESMCRSRPVNLSSGAPTMIWNFRASPRGHRPAGELAVGLHESLVEEHGGEPGPVAELVAEAEPERGADDERDELLGLATGCGAELAVLLSGPGVGSDGVLDRVHLDVKANVEELVAVRLRPAKYCGSFDPRRSAMKSVRSANTSRIWSNVIDLVARVAIFRNRSGTGGRSRC